MLILFLALSRCHVIGNWSDSKVFDESNELLHKIGINIANLPDSAEAIIENLEELEGKEIADLMNFSLKFRLFHPKASIKNPQSNSNPLITGWYETRPTNVSFSDARGIQWKMLSLLFLEEQNRADDWELLKSMLYDFASVDSKLAEIEVTNEVMHAVAETRDILTINGRIVKPKIWEAATALIEEYMNLEMCKRLNFTRSEQESLHFAPVSSPVRLFMPMPNVQFGATIRDILSDSRIELATKIDTSFPPTIDRVRIRLLNLHYFAKLGDRESAAFLEAALDELKHPNAVSLTVFPIGRIGNEEERRALFAFYRILEQYSAREAVGFLLNGLTKGYKKAYESYKVGPKWELLETLMVPTTIQFAQVSELCNYIADRGIDSTVLLVNGDPSANIQTDLVKYWISVNQEMQNYMRSGILSTETNLSELLLNESVFINTMGDLESYRTRNNYISLHKRSVAKQSDFIHLVNRSQVLYAKGLDRNRLLVIVTDSSSSAFLEDLPTNISYEVRVVDHKWFNNAKIIIGGCLLYNVPDTKELVRLVETSYHEFYRSIPDSISQIQAIYWVFWKGSMKNDLVLRSEHLNLNDDFTAITDNGLIECESSFNILHPIGREIVSILDEFSQFGLISIKCQPFARGEDLYHLPDHFTQVFIPHYASNTNKEPLLGSTLHFPDEWTVEKRGEDWIVSGVSMYGYTDPYTLVEIGTKVRRSAYDGFFTFTLPVGLYNCSMEKTVKVASLSFAYIGFSTSAFSGGIHTQNDTLNVLSFTPSREFDDQTLVMMHTLTNYCNTHVKFWLIGTFHEKLPVRYDVEILPLILPPAVTNASSYTDKLRLAKLMSLESILPPEIDRILFCDPGTVWTGDASRFSRLDMKNASIALPDISQMNSGAKNWFFMQQSYISERFHRPFHTTAVFYINLTAWREQRSTETLVALYNRLSKQRKLHMIDNEIMNIAQGRIQVMTLPEETTLCDSFTEAWKSSSALSISLCSATSFDHIGEDWETLVKKSRV